MWLDSDNTYLRSARTHYYPEYLEEQSPCKSLSGGSFAQSELTNLYKTDKQSPVSTHCATHKIWNIDGAAIDSVNPGIVWES